MKTTSWLPVITAAILLTTLSRGIAQTNVTGIVVDVTGKPIKGVACLLAGTSSANTHSRVMNTADVMPIITDNEGRFSLTPPEGFLADLQFDAGDFAPVFLYRVDPKDSPLRVVMTDGKVLKGRIVDEQHAPIANAEIELQMGQQDRWYQRVAFTDGNGEFRFRISPPPQHAPWQLFYAGKRFEVDYSKVAPGLVYTLQTDVRGHFESEQVGATNSPKPISPETNSIPWAYSSRH